MIEQMGVPNVIAIDVGRHDAREATNYGDTLSGWWLFWRQTVLEKLWPWAEKVVVPNAIDVQTRLTYLSSVRLQDLLKRAKCHVHMRPPVQEFGTMWFHMARLIYEIGREFSEDVFPRKRDVLQRMKSQMYFGAAAARRPQSMLERPSNDGGDSAGASDDPVSRTRSASQKRKPRGVLHSVRTFSLTNLLVCGRKSATLYVIRRFYASGVQAPSPRRGALA